MLSSIRKTVTIAGVALATAAFALSATLPAQAATSYVPISGAGSSWSANAVEQWRTNVQQYGMRVNFASTGSSDGRNQFRNGTVDYAVSEIPYGLRDGSVVDSPPANRPFAYMPIVAGGTAMMYNLTSGGKQITNLRLSGEVITKIFTGTITKWDDAAIKADNPSVSLPSRKIVPVVRSDGSGSTAQFTAWMTAKFPALWGSYCNAAGRGSGCGLTSNFPVISGKGFVAQPNSTGVAGYVKQRANDGTITYVEYSYALNAGFPVAKVLNQSGYYVEPTAQNVAVGLLGAKINSDLTSNLTGVYNNSDARAYPMSSYSYMIVPTSNANNFTNDKGNTLGSFAKYFLCEGQQQAPALGYSPLPINLVKSGFDQIKKIPGAASIALDISKCNNPTFSADGSNTLAKNAPQPQACDKQGATQCATGTGGAATTSNAAGGAAAGAAATGADGATGSGSSGNTITGPMSCNADTGQCVAVNAEAIKIAAEPAWTVGETIMAASVLLLILIVLLPPVLSRVVKRKGS
jgi:phosphate ABC transporter phosphate-binding protein